MRGQQGIAMQYEGVPGITRMQVLFRVVQSETGLSRAIILGERRSQSIVNVRHAAWLVCRDLFPGMTPSWIGRQFDRDRTSIIHAFETAQRAGIESEKIRIYVNCREKTNAILSRILPLPKLAPSATSAAVRAELTFKPQKMLRSGYIDSTGAIICLP